MHICHRFRFILNLVEHDSFLQKLFSTIQKFEKSITVNNVLQCVHLQLLPFSCICFISPSSFFCVTSLPIIVLPAAMNLHSWRFAVCQDLYLGIFLEHLIKSIPQLYQIGATFIPIFTERLRHSDETCLRSPSKLTPESICLISTSYYLSLI